MKVITTMKNAIEVLQETILPQNVIKDILLNTYIFETEFQGSTLNRIIILEQDENYLMPYTIPEIEEDIDNYHKKVFIISDTGEGVLMYLKQTQNTTTLNPIDNTKRLQALLYNAISYIEDEILSGRKLIKTKTANEIGINNEEYEYLMGGCSATAENTANNLAERRKIKTE